MKLVISLQLFFLKVFSFNILSTRQVVIFFFFCILSAFSHP